MRRSSVLTGLFLLAFMVVHGITNGASLERMKYNHPGLIDDLAVGLWAWPVPTDVNGDGFPDLIVTCEDQPYNGTYYFESRGDDRKHPTFKQAKRISSGQMNLQASYVNGKLRVLSPGKEYPDYVRSGMSNPVPVSGLPDKFQPKTNRGNMWKYVDYNGDGLTDLIVGTDIWSDYGWDNAYNEQGKWQNGPLRGHIHVALNRGTNDKPQYDKTFQLCDTEGKPLETFGWPSPNFADWDGDGDLDIVVGEFRDSLFYFENTGTRTEPKYKAVQALTHEDGSAVSVDLEMIVPVAFDWDGDGDLDIIAGDEDGRVALFENTGKLKDHKPLFLKPYYFQQVADDLKCGALATPWGFDWDGDGDWDLISGNSAGYLFYFENLSGPGVESPKWARGIPFVHDGQPIRIMAGPNGSIQGPCEEKWGYTTLSISDWDLDGLPDLVVNSIWGKVIWYKNEGKRGQVKLSEPKPIEVEWKDPQPRLKWGWLKPEGKQLLTQWRTTPIAVDWNRDGLPDLVVLDQEGYLAFFERYRDGDTLRLKAPRRIFVDAKGDPLRFNAGKAGGSGRRKICFVDYNGDGRLDILLNSTNADLHLQTADKDGLFFFSKCGPIDPRPIQGHSTSPTFVDFNNDGVMDPVIGAEDGHFYYKRNMPAVHETESLSIEAVLPLLPLNNEVKAYGNRDYVWKNLPKELCGGQFLQTLGGMKIPYSVTAKKDTRLFIMLFDDECCFNDKTWEPVSYDVCYYTDGGKTRMALYTRTVKAGEKVFPPQNSWTGSIIILPKDNIDDWVKKNQKSIQAGSQKEGTPPPPGTVFGKSTNWRRQYLGSPSMEILSDHTIVATHDWFGSGSGGQHTTVLHSKDAGKSWNQIGVFTKQSSSTLFKLNGDTLYSIGYGCPKIKGYGEHCIVIRKSTDGGRTWTTPKDDKSGIIFSDRRYYSDPVPVLIHNGRVWWQVDVVNESIVKRWPAQFMMAVISAPIDSDLLNKANWTITNPVEWPGDERVYGWLEGNVLVDPKGKLLVLTRLESAKEPRGAYVARLELSPDGKQLSFDPKKGILDFPGGGAKFCVRYDEQSKRYWALTNWVRPKQKGNRNLLALVSSPDLKKWNIHKIVYEHAEPQMGFQYIDWRFVGNHIDFVCRLAWYGKNFHDSNYMIFDRVENARSLVNTKLEP